jgi:hypothetical protein
MKDMTYGKSVSGAFLFVFSIAFFGSAFGERSGWKREEVELRLPNNMKARAIRYPEGKRPLTRGKMESRPVRRKAKKVLDRWDSDTNISIPEEVGVSIIDSPPLGGFVPWVVVTLTDERSDESDYSDYPETSVVGDYLAPDPAGDFAIGLFDTGASIHLASYGARQRMDITNDLLTPNPLIITGVTGEVETLVSYPIGVFATGVDALAPTSGTDPNAVIVDTSGMVGHTNVSIAVGKIPEPNLPDIPTVIGTPLSVNFNTVINTEQEITITYEGQTYSTPDIEFYEEGDPSIPNYTSYVPLRLVPEGSIDVQYFPDLLAIMDLIFRPLYPSMIMGTSMQSRFFINAVHLYEGSFDSEDKARFLLDTGAQITVIGDYVAANLKLNPEDAEFWVEIAGVTGEIVEKPGFYIDALEIEGVGEWLEFTNVPVVHLENEYIPGGDGTPLDGIIGMNLLMEYNLVLRGNYSAPELRFEYIANDIVGDIAPAGGDGEVNILDIVMLANCWLATSPPPSANWDSDCDIAPAGALDGKIDLFDFALMAEHWLE